MSSTSDTGFGIAEPTLPVVLRTVFDMSETELDICLCVMQRGEQTVTDLTEQVKYDRSVVNRHLNHLVELGVLEVRGSLIAAFVGWVHQVTPLLESLSREKVKAIVDSDAENPQWRIYQK